MNKFDVEDNYKKWWKGKYIRPVGQTCEFTKCVDLKFIAPPSGIYGVVDFINEDGSTWVFGGISNGFRPTKKDIEVKKD